jgi:opacity protein-like surface antigen
MPSAPTKCAATTLPFLLATLCFAPDAGAQESPQPPPTNVEYFQYGVGLAVETRASGGDVCPAGASQENGLETPCILGSGGGLALRIGYRARGHWYAGGAYEFSRQDSSNLLRLAILQQLRGEARYYWELGTRLSPYLIGGLGAVLYGNEWTAVTGGVATSLGAGVEYQITQSVVIGMSPAYRLLVLRGWTDSTGQQRADRYLGFGFAHMFALELTLELRDALSRW